jgi:putative ABC transport system substrate-binding protein
MAIKIARRNFIATLVGAAAWPLAANAQQPLAMPVIGFLGIGYLATLRPLVSAFRKGLGDVGYVESQNVKVEYRWAEYHYDRLPALAADLVREHVAVIVSSGGEVAALAAQKETTTIPIVFNSNADPVQLGLVASLNRPGGNLTGVSLLTTAPVIGKRIKYLHALISKSGLFGLLVNASSPNAEFDTKEAQAAAQVMGQKLVVDHVAADRDLDTAYAALVQQKIDAIIIQSDPLFTNQRDTLVALAARYRIPAIYGRREIAVAGGLISYGSDLADAYRQQGAYAGRILKGEKPADLPVVQPTTFELVINLKTAKTFGLEVPANLLALADEVIE